jgi:hypothetical protein
MNQTQRSLIRGDSKREPGETVLWQTRWRGQTHNFVLGAGEELIPLEIWLEERGQSRAEASLVVRSQSP